MDRMQMHYHNYKLLIFRCLFRATVIIDLLCVVQKIRRHFFAKCELKLKV